MLTNQVSFQSCHFLRCVLPNDKKQCNYFDDSYVSSQLTSSSAFAYRKLLACGYPKRVDLRQFLSAYEPYSSSANRSATTFVTELLRAIGFGKTEFKIGSSLIFFRRIKNDIVDNFFSPASVVKNIAALEKSSYFRKKWRIVIEAVRYTLYYDRRCQYRKEQMETVMPPILEQTAQVMSAKRELDEKTEQTTKKCRSSSEQRYDQVSHIPEVDPNVGQTRCKLEGCSLKSRIRCIKCNVHLCLKQNRNCFKKFHETQEK